MSTRAVGLGVQRRPLTPQNGLWETVPGLHRELVLRLLSELVARMVTAAGRGRGHGRDPRPAKLAKPRSPCSAL